jgi:hypothetical protein
MLIIKLDVEKTKENYTAAVAALADFDIASVSWETDPIVAQQVKGKSSDNLSDAVSAALKLMERRTRAT